MHRALLALTLTLGLVACQPADDQSNTQPTTAPGQPTAAPDGEATDAPVVDDDALPAVEGFPPQTNAAVVQPPEHYEEMTRLSNFLDYELVGLEQSPLGQVNEYIINTCETYIVYMQVAPDSGLDVEGGQNLLIPYESVTINNGIVDGDARTIALNLAPADFANAPMVADPLPLFPLDWEEPARAFWGEQVRVGKLHSGCQVTPENSIHKIAYARELLKAPLKDELRNELGTVREAIFEPATGKLSFYLVELGDGGLVLVPIARTNIPEEALEPDARLELVLLAENAQLEGAPRLGSADEATSPDAQNSARAYWGQ
jgi:hypothetical protein